MRVFISVDSDWNTTRMGEFAHTARVRGCRYVEIPDIDIYPETRTIVFSCDIQFGARGCAEWKFVHYLDMVRAAFLPFIIKTQKK